MGLSDTAKVMMTSTKSSDLANVWPEQNASTAGVYGWNFNTMDMCGRTATATATLDYRCNNPPVALIVSGTTQSFTVQLGQVRA
jgi:hypothetical protein